jgi:hypothetical protein
MRRKPRGNIARQANIVAPGTGHAPQDVHELQFAHEETLLQQMIRWKNA